MTSIVQQLETEQSHAPAADSSPLPLPDEQQVRAGAYQMLSALLGSAPGQEVLDRIAGLAAAADARDEIGLAMSMLGLAARDSRAGRVGDEYQELFIGLGRGELMPYASWYLTGYLMEAPLGVLRGDLAQLGIERDPRVNEPEDHIAMLCDVMAMLIRDGSRFERQQQFFRAHLAPWSSQFCADLSNANAAVFYRALGRFGQAFFELEHRYFSMRL